MQFNSSLGLVPRAGRGSSGAVASSRPLARARLLLATLAAAVLAAAAMASSASAALTSVGPINPSNNFPSFYKDANGVGLQICEDGPPNCLSGPELLQDVHAAGGDAEAFYWAADAETSHFALHDALEAAYAADGPGQEVTFQRTQVTASSTPTAAGSRRRRSRASSTAP
jgi:hypothetical protein